MPAPRLSVCIPTYNFGRFIGETLSSIAPEAGSAIEVVVVDGGSTDNTEEVVETFKPRIPGLAYHRLDSRGGIDADMAKSVELAHAPYCWLFSADDVMEPGALTRVLGELQAGCDIYVCGLTLCSIDMVPLRRHRVMAFGENADFELAESGDRSEYFRRATTSTAFFSYMSSLVINRVRWIRAGSPDNFMGSCWAHVARIFGMIPDGLRVRYLADSYLLNRGGNDSFQESGLIHRIGIAVNGYWRLADTYFGPKSLEARNIRRAVGNEYSLRYLLSAKWGARAGARHKDERDLDGLVAMLWQDGTLSNHFKHLAYRRAPLQLTRAIYRTLRYGSLSSWSDVFHVQD